MGWDRCHTHREEPAAVAGEQEALGGVWEEGHAPTRTAAGEEGGRRQGRRQGRKERSEGREAGRPRSSKPHAGERHSRHFPPRRDGHGHSSRRAGAAQNSPRLRPRPEPAGAEGAPRCRTGTCPRPACGREPRHAGRGGGTGGWREPGRAGTRYPTAPRAGGRHRRRARRRGRVASLPLPFPRPPLGALARRRVGRRALSEVKPELGPRPPHRAEDSSSRSAPASGCGWARRARDVRPCNSARSRCRRGCPPRSRRPRGVRTPLPTTRTDTHNTHGHTHAHFPAAAPPRCRRT